jgi:hypothetical protein
MEVTMQVKNVDEYKGNFQDWLPTSKIDDVLEYNKHDVEATEELLYRCKKDIDFWRFLCYSFKDAAQWGYKYQELLLDTETGE